MDQHRFVTKHCSKLLSVPRFCFAQNHSALGLFSDQFPLTLSEQRRCTFNFCPVAISKCFCCAKEACGGLRILDCDAKCFLLSNLMTGEQISRRVPALIVPSAVTKARVKRCPVWLPCSTVTALLLAWLSWMPLAWQSFLGRSQQANSAHAPENRVRSLGSHTSHKFAGAWHVGQAEERISVKRVQCSKVADGLDVQQGALTLVKIHRDREARRAAFGVRCAQVLG